MLPAAFPLGPFLVEAGGKLNYRAPVTRAAFSFVWRDRRVTARLDGDQISLLANLGRVPSSAVAGGTVRTRVLALVRALPRLLPAGFALRLRADHRVEIFSDSRLDWPATAGELVTPLVAFALALAPYLDVFDEALAG